MVPLAPHKASAASADGAFAPATSSESCFDIKQRHILLPEGTQLTACGSNLRNHERRRETKRGQLAVAKGHAAEGGPGQTDGGARRRGGDCIRQHARRQSGEPRRRRGWCEGGPRHRATRRVAFRTAEDRVRVVCGAERRRRPATERGAVRCAGGWRADAWGAGGSVRVAGKLEGSFADKSIGNDEPLVCCVGVGRNTQSAGDNEPLVCRPLQVS